MKIPEPLITRDDERGVWLLASEIVAPSRGVTLVVPKGFETDLASVPRPLWNIIAPFDLSLVGPICHDWLYRHGGAITTRRGDDVLIDETHRFTRYESDLFLLDLMTQENIAPWRRNLAFLGVRLGGRSSWQS